MSQNQTGTDLLESEIPLGMFENDDKIDYTEYQQAVNPPEVEIVQEDGDNQTDCDCECDSEFMANMPTNESYSISEGNEQRNEDQAIKYLTETGILTKVDNTRVHFDLNCRSDSSNLGDIDIYSRVSQDKVNHDKLDEDHFTDTFKIFDDPFNEQEFNPADTLEQQLRKDPIPEAIALDISVSDKMSDIGVEKDSEIELYPQNLFEKDPDLQVTLSKGLSCENRPTIDSSENEQEKLKKKEAKTPKRKLTEFGYLLQRKGFRLMRKYYKEKSNFKHKKKTTVNEINHMILQFAGKEFGGILSMLDQKELEELITGLKIIILSDRSNKKEPMIEGLDFSEFKNLCAKYTSKKMKAFLSKSTNSFLYTHFYLIYGRLAAYEQKDVDCENFNVQMKKLVKESCQNLSSSVKPVYENLLAQNRMMI